LAGKLSVAQSDPTGLLGDLKRLGFTEYEARVYVQLLRSSPATAYEVSKSAGVPRPNTYTALEALAQRGAVLPVSQRPVRYVAAAPDDLFPTIARQTEALCDDLVVRMSSLSSWQDDQYVWMLRGDAAVHDKIDVLIEKSQTVIWVKAADDVLRRHERSLRTAAKRGVELVIVLFGIDAEEFRFSEHCRIYIHENNGVRVGTADNLFTLAVDHTEMLTARIEDEVVAAHTQNSPIVNLAESLIRHDYYMAEIFARFGPLIDDAFGPYLRDLRLSCFTPEQARSFKERTKLS
jgi:HTH-type transcriptional regulator, sugar sensing transcriptional regulator